MADNNLYTITSTNEYKTVSDLLNDTKSVASVYSKTPDYFLSILGNDGLTNRDRIIKSFPTYRQKELKDVASDKLPLPTGTVLYVESQRVDEDVIVKGIELVSTDTIAFKSAQLAALEDDKGYVSVTPIQSGYIQNGRLKTAYPDVTVWVWCKSLSTGTNENELKGELFDITSFVETVTTNMGKNGGNFHISLPPLVCELDSDNRWIIKPATLTQFNDGSGYVSQVDMYNLQADVTGQPTLSRNQFLFNTMITANDLIFIRFETLHLEKEQRLQEIRNYRIDKNMIAGRIYDMIALVDSVSIGINAQNNDVRLQIEGRDLSKLFLDDGTYFFALENSQGMIKVAGETRLKGSSVSRLATDGSMLFMGLYQFHTIEFITKFVIQQLSNIKLVPDDLFTSYGTRINKKFDVIQQQKLSDVTSKDVKKNTNYKYEPQIKEENAPGIWGIVKLLMDDEIQKRRLCDTSFSSAAGALINFIRGIAQEPLVEFYGDTYGDQYVLTFRKPPYDQKSIISLLEGRINTEDKTINVHPVIVDIEEMDVLQERLAMDDTQVYSWYHFFPKYSMMGTDNDFSLAYLPAVYFPEYAEAYGSRPFQQTHAYLPFDKNANIADFEQQAFLDMKYVIESSQYLPFSRKGTITINGDRRIKIGNLIRYKATGEVFYVSHVAQHFQITENGIERTTTIHVERGLVEQLIYGTQFTNSEGVTRYISYFNIIDTTLTLEQKDIPVTTVTRTKVGTREVETPVAATVNSFSDFVGNVATRIQNIIGLGETLQHPELVVGSKKLEDYNSYPQYKAKFIKFINDLTSLGYVITITSTGLSHKRIAEINRQNSSIGNTIAAQATKYGFIDDPNLDTNSAAGIGNRNNRLIPGLSVALSKETAAKLNLAYGEKLKVTLPDGTPKIVSYDDTIPSGYSNDRIDFYTPSGILDYDGRYVKIEKTSGDVASDPFRKSTIEINVKINRSNTFLNAASKKEKWVENAIVELAKKNGMKWGGEDQNNPNVTLFEVPTTMQTTTEDVYKEEIHTEYVKALDRDAVFSKFKVNKFVFNFFIKNLQFKPEYRIVKNK